jgi:hypothetical protein
MSNRPAFLTIPLELRLQIYEIILEKRPVFQPDYYVCITAVCRQIRREILPVVFKGARHLKSLAHLSKWTSQGSPFLLKQVQKISLHISTESLSSFATVPERAPQVTENVPAAFTGEWWDLQYAERAGLPGPQHTEAPSSKKAVISKVLRTLRLSSKDSQKGPRKSSIASTWEALASIDQLKSLWILLNDATNSSRPKYDIEQQLVLDMVSAACPKMQDFTVFSNLLPLEYMRNFHGLRLLRFSGYSRSSPQEILEIFRSLPYLETIIIYRYPEFYDTTHAIARSALADSLCLTPEVLANMNPLKRFEILHMTPRVPSEHLTVPMIRALKEHRTTLGKLLIRSDRPVREGVLKEILSFVAASRITNLHVELIVPKRFESLDNMDTYFPPTAHHREVHMSKSELFSPDKELVCLKMKAYGLLGGNA